MQCHAPATGRLWRGGRAGEGVSGKGTAHAIQAAAAGSADGAGSDMIGKPACLSVQQGHPGETHNSPAAGGSDDAARDTSSKSGGKSEILDSNDDLPLPETACWLPGRADLLITDLLDHRWHSFNLHTQALCANAQLKSKKNLVNGLLSLTRLSGYAVQDFNLGVLAACWVWA